MTVWKAGVIGAALLIVTAGSLGSSEETGALELNPNNGFARTRLERIETAQTPTHSQERD